MKHPSTHDPIEHTPGAVRHVVGRLSGGYDWGRVTTPPDAGPSTHLWPTMIRHALALAAIGSFAASVALAQPPAVSHLVPAGIQPGKPTDVVFHGGNLASPTGQ